ncbi:MAG: septum formation initiator family protein [Salaquimonas sp.]
MSTRQKHQSRLTGFIVPLLCTAILGYFAYHAQTGRYSIHTKQDMKEEAMRLQIVLSGLEAERTKLERRVAQLTSGTLEKDALDEVIRSQLGYAAPDEMVVLYQ